MIFLVMTVKFFLSSSEVTKPVDLFIISDAYFFSFNCYLNMPKEFKRTERVNELIQRELAMIIQREFHQPELGMITLSAVEISPDLKNAKVFVTLLENHGSVHETIKYLNQQASFLRHLLSQRLTIRTTPRLTFIHDKSVVEGQRLSALIDAVVSKSDSKGDDH